MEPQILQAQRHRGKGRWRSLWFILFLNERNTPNFPQRGRHGFRNPPLFSRDPSCDTRLRDPDRHGALDSGHVPNPQTHGFKAGRNVPEQQRPRTWSRLPSGWLLPCAFTVALNVPSHCPKLHQFGGRLCHGQWAPNLQGGKDSSVYSRPSMSVTPSSDIPKSPRKVKLANIPSSPLGEIQAQGPASQGHICVS